MDLSLTNCYYNGTSYNMEKNGNIEYFCDCDVGYYNTDCSVGLLPEYKNAWIILQVIYTFAYVIIAGFTWFNLIKELVKVIFI